jgi:hypothetical protein
MGGPAGRVSWVRLLLGDLGEGLPAPGDSKPKVLPGRHFAKRRLTSPDVLAPPTEMMGSLPDSVTQSLSDDSQPCHPPTMTTLPNPDSTTRGGLASWQNLTDSLPQPVDPAERDDTLWQALNAQFRWYERAATRNRVSYQALKVVAIVFGAAVAVLAAADAPAAITAGLAASVVVLEGIQQVFQFHPNWITYRATAETLRQTPSSTSPEWAPTPAPRAGVTSSPKLCAISRLRKTPAGRAPCVKPRSRQPCPSEDINHRAGRAQFDVRELNRNALSRG